MPFFMQMNEEDNENILRVTMYVSRPEDMSEEERTVVHRSFQSFVMSVVVFEVCLFGFVLLGELLLLLGAAFFLYQAIGFGKFYYDAAIGRGLKSEYVFFRSVFRYVSQTRTMEYAYSAVRRVTESEQGIIIELQGQNGMHFIPRRALEENELEQRLPAFLRGKVGRRYRLEEKSPEQARAEALQQAEEEQARIDRLGASLGVVKYTVDSEHMRQYHRVLLRVSPPLRRVRGILLPVLAACTTVLPIMGWLFSAAICDHMFLVFLCGTLALYLLPKVGLTGPARRAFLAKKKDDLVCYLHSGGLAARCGETYLCKTWQEMDAVWFDEDGVIADLEEGKTVFLPGDMVVGPIRDAMRVAAEAARRPQAKADSAAPTRSKK